MTPPDRRYRTAGIPLLACAAALLLGRIAPAAEPDEDHAIILLYHHVSESTPRSTSVSPAEFESHLNYLDANGYAVLPLIEIVTALRDRHPLPPKTVALTFDDAYESILTEAMPRLRRRGWPFTVFVSTEAVDREFSGFMSWPDLRELESAGGTIANHTVSHDHLVRRRQDETESSWRQRVYAEIRKAEVRLDEEIDNPARLFAWPYGEFDSTLEAIAKDLGYIAFGQQSGPAGYESGLQSLPRFPLASGFAGLDNFAEKLRTRPLPVTVISPERRVLASPAAPPVLELRIPAGPYRRDELRCYVSGQDPATVERQGDTVRVVARQRLRPGRNKFNCTAPSAGESGVYYWYSHLWLQPHDDGSWYAE